VCFLKKEEERERERERERVEEEGERGARFPLVIYKILEKTPVL
jgi:hypothetical protein